MVSSDLRGARLLMQSAPVTSRNLRNPSRMPGLWLSGIARPEFAARVRITLVDVIFLGAMKLGVVATIAISCMEALHPAAADARLHLCLRRPGAEPRAKTARCMCGR